MKVTVNAQTVNQMVNADTANVSQQVGIETEEARKFFETILEKIDNKPTLSQDEKVSLKQDVHEVKQELSKNEQADESLLTQRLQNIGKMAPDILEIVLATITNPIAGFGVLAKKVAEKAKLPS